MKKLADKFPFPNHRAFNDGYWAFRNGSVSNPYPKDSDGSLEWERGFNTAYFRNLLGLKPEAARS